MATPVCATKRRAAQALAAAVTRLSAERFFAGDHCGSVPDLPTRVGENRWVVRLYGPHGETSDQIFTRLVGTEMNPENEVDYAIGFIDGGTPLFGTDALGRALLRGLTAGPMVMWNYNWHRCPISACARPTPVIG
jgi:hypothetical protein